MGKLPVNYKYCVSGRSNFDIAFLPDCTMFCNFFSVCWIGNLIRIPKMCLKPSFYHSKWVLQSILFLTVLSNCVSFGSNFDTAFLPDFTKFCTVFSGYWIGNLMRISKMCFKQSISYWKCVLPAIMSLTVLTNCVSGSSNFDIAPLPDFIKFCTVFLGYWIGNLLRIPKMC